MQTAALLPLFATFWAAATLGFPTQSTAIPEAYDVDGLVTINGSETEWPSVMYFPDDNGVPTAAEIYGVPVRMAVEESDVFFKLYTRMEVITMDNLHSRRGPTEGEIIPPGDVDALKNSSFNASEATFFITHGYTQSIKAESVQGIRDMYIAYVGGNVIAVDWSTISTKSPYFTVKSKTVEVGQFVGAFTAFLVREAGVNVKHVHLIGHSLGAHVVGIAGKTIHLMVGQKPGRITGLDPAGPLYSVDDKDNRLDREDADFVDVIHTCGGWLGMSSAIGHADYYPNGGKMRQPGCSIDVVNMGSCSHSRSWRFFTESINTLGFSAQPCASYEEYLAGKCEDNRQVAMGHHTDKSASGAFYLKTAKRSPFAKG